MFGSINFLKYTLVSEINLNSLLFSFSFFLEKKWINLQKNLFWNKIT